MEQHKLELRFVRRIGKEIATVTDDLAELRMTVFKDFPYLYEGNREYEEAYLAKYANAEQAMAFLIYEGDRAVGGTTCIPLKNETEAVRKPFLEAGLNPADFFYFGESILLEAYRGNGFGRRFFTEREEHALKCGYQQVCFCAVDRPETHPLKPENYRDNEEFWRKNGFEPVPALRAEMAWQDVGEPAETVKKLTFWTKRLPS